MDVTPPPSPGRNRPGDSPQNNPQSTRQSEAKPQLTTQQPQNDTKAQLQEAWGKTEKSTSGPPYVRVRQAILDLDPKALADALVHGGPQLVNSIHPDTKLTPLMMAVESGALEIVDVLLSTDGIHVNDRLEDGRTALHLACERGESLILEALLRHGAHPNTTDRDNDTPFIAACDSGQLNCVILMVNHISKAHMNHQDQNGMTALSSAADCGHHQVVEFLIRSGADVNAQDTNGWTPAFHIVNSAMPAEDKIRLLKLAAKNGADLRHHGADATNLFSIALAVDDAETLSYLIGKGVKNLKNKDPLIHAAENGLKNACHCLLKHQFNTGVCDRHGYTPLMHAAKAGHWEIAEMLMCAGSDLRHRGDFNMTALDLAAQLGHGMVAERLLQHSGPVLHVSTETLKLLLSLSIQSEYWGINEFLRKKILYDSNSGQLLSVDDHLPFVVIDSQKKSASVNQNH